MKPFALEALGIYFLALWGLFSSEDIAKPVLPKVFQTEVQGIFMNQLEEVDGSLYYDSKNNRAALFYTYLNVSTRTIYNFDTDEMIYIDGNECSVSAIPKQNFIPYSVKNNKKVIGTPEEVLFFTDSKYQKQDVSVFPVSIFTTVTDIPQYEKKNCTVSHVFSKPEVERSTCDNHACQPTLMTISVKCPGDSDEADVDHTYNFFRFRSNIEDTSVFAPPIGVHCQIKDTRPFPAFPPYFSFSYDITEKKKDSEEDTVYSSRRKVWYDSEFGLVRIDEFGDGGLLQSSRVFDVIGKSAYTIVASIPTCDMGPITSRLEFDQVTRLPRIFFSQNTTEADTAVYAGKRIVHGLIYDVWSLTWIDQMTEAKIVEEIYFIRTARNIDSSSDKEAKKDYWLLSHAYIFTYEEDDDNGNFELSLLSYISLNNFRSQMKELGAFDVAACFGNKNKKVFKLKISGPPMVKGSDHYLEAMELLERKIIEKTKASILRISELTGTFDGIYMSEVNGYILDNSAQSAWEKRDSGPGMEEVYRLIKEAALAGDLSFVLRKDKLLKFNVTFKSPDVEIPDISKPVLPDVFQTEVQGIFMNRLEEVDGSLYYDRKNNRAALFYTYQNVSKRTIYNFDTDEMIYIEGNECSVSEITRQEFIPFSVKNNKKIIGSPEEVLFFTNSKYERQDLSVFPVYIFTTVTDIPQYEKEKCTVSHVFSRPEVELSTCDNHACQPTLMTISVKCPGNSDEADMDHTYNFFRFRSDIEDTSVFAPPIGVHCQIKDNRPFPAFPPYFSFSYDITEKLKDSEEDSVYSTHKKVWYDSEFRLVRVDEFGDGGLLQSSRVFDVIGKSAYTIVATLPTCDMGPIMSRLEFDQVTRLPRIFFSQNTTRADTAVFAGKRIVHGLIYDVWSLTWIDEMTEAKIVEEVYFIRTARNVDSSSDKDEKKDYWLLSHAYIFTYEKNADNGNFELSLLTYISLNDFHSQMKELGAFDVAECFGTEDKKVFKLEISGPPIVKGSHHYLEAMELLERKIIEKTKASILRISELTGTFDGIYMTEVKGYILNNSLQSAWVKRDSGPGVDEVYKLIKEAALAGELSFVLREDKLLKFNVTFKSPDVEIQKEKQKSCYSGGTMAIACVTLLVIGVAFGLAGYYAFLKKRKPTSMDMVQLHPVDMK